MHVNLVEGPAPFAARVHTVNVQLVDKLEGEQISGEVSFAERLTTHWALHSGTPTVAHELAQTRLAERVLAKRHFGVLKHICADLAIEHLGNLRSVAEVPFDSYFLRLLLLIEFWIFAFAAH